MTVSEFKEISDKEYLKIDICSSSLNSSLKLDELPISESMFQQKKSSHMHFKFHVKRVCDTLI